MFLLCPPISGACSCSLEREVSLLAELLGFPSKGVNRWGLALMWNCIVLGDRPLGACSCVTSSLAFRDAISTSLAVMMLSCSASCSQFSFQSSLTLSLCFCIPSFNHLTSAANVVFSSVALLRACCRSSPLPVPLPSQVCLCLILPQSHVDAVLGPVLSSGRFRFRLVSRGVLGLPQFHLYDDLNSWWFVAHLC